MPIAKDEKINVLLEGPIGTGKTTSLLTILENTNKELFVLALEPGIHTILNKIVGERENLHWAYVPPARTPWDTLIDNAKKINRFPMDALQKTVMHKDEYQQFIEVLELLADFKCQRPNCSCGNASFGPVDSWGTDRVLAIDGLSGLSRISMDLVVGAKPIKTQPEWGVAQDNLRRLLDKLTSDTKCSFILISHVDKKEDKLNGGFVTTVSTLGQALAPEIPKFFDEVIFAYRSGSDFYWSTVEPSTDLKSRVLPLQDELKPDFSLIFGTGDD